MPNIASIYTELTTVRKDEKEGKPAKEIDAGRWQLLTSWHQSTVTKEMMQELSKECVDLLSEAVTLATTYSQHQNHIKIIHNLIRVDTLKKVMKYGTSD